MQTEERLLRSIIPRFLTVSKSLTKGDPEDDKDAVDRPVCLLLSCCISVSLGFCLDRAKPDLMMDFKGVLLKSQLHL
jgi:hypothetical protein